MNKPTDFEIFAYMSKNDLDIRMSPHLVSANKVRAGGHVTHGVDERTVLDLLTGTIQTSLYAFDKKLFFDLKENGIPQGEVIGENILLGDMPEFAEKIRYNTHLLQDVMALVADAKFDKDAGVGSDKILNLFADFVDKNYIWKGAKS